MTEFYPIKEVDHVKQNVTEKIDKMLKKGRRYFGSSGANFTEQAFKSDWKDLENSKSSDALELVEAERHFTKILQGWIKDKPNAVLIDSVYTPKENKLNLQDFNDSEGLLMTPFTSHILLIGNEVFIIDSLPFKKKKRYALDENARILETDKEFLYTDKVNMSNKFTQWIDYFDHEALLTSMIGFTGEEAYTERYKTWFQSPYRLLEENRYLEFFDQKYEVIDEENRTKINPNLVAQSVIRCVKPFDRYENIFNKDALAKFK